MEELLKDNNQLRAITVEKKSGKIETFDEEKLTRGISRAGTPFLIAKDIAQSVHNKLKENDYQHSSISSQEIRNYVLEELRSREQNVTAEAYSGYIKSKGKHESKVTSSMNTHAKQHAKDKDNTSGRGTKTGI